MFILHVHLLYGLSVLFRLYLHHSTPSSNFGQVPGLSPFFLNSAMLKIIFWNWIPSEIFFSPSYTLMSRQPIHFFQAVHSLSWHKEVHFRCCIDGTETDRTLNLVFIFQNQIKVSLQFCFVSNAVICEQHVDQGSFVLLSKLMRNLPAPLNQWLESLRISPRRAVVYYALPYQGSNQIISQWGYGRKQTTSLVYIICCRHCLLG